MKRTVFSNASTAGRAFAAAIVLSVTAGALLVPASATAQEASKPAAQRAPLDVVKEFLENTAPDKVDAAAKRLVAPDATYGTADLIAEIGRMKREAGTIVHRIFTHQDEAIELFGHRVRQQEEADAA